MISIIIPVYNSVKYIDNCISSVLSQTLTDWECILVDDGSTDGSGKRCDYWAGKDPRVKTLHQPNKGVSAARNAGLELITGDYLSFVDSDDWLDCDCLQLLYEKIITSDTELCTVGFYYEYPNKRVDNYSIADIVSIEPSCVDSFADLNKHFLLFVPVAKLYKSSIIRERRLRFEENCSYGEDLLFNYAYLEHVRRIANIPDCKYHYRQIKGSLSHRVNSHKFDIDYTQWKKLKDFFQKKNLWLEPSRQLLYARLWGIVYDALFLFPCLTQKEYSYLKRILQIPEIESLNKYASIFDCASWIKRSILHRRAWLFYLFFLIR